METKKICPKCGHEVDNTSLICMYCGHNINGSTMANDTIKDLKENEPTYEKNRTNTTASVCSIGLLLMIIGGFCDVISLFLLVSGSYSSVSSISFGGTICFIIGLVLRFSFFL